MKQAFLQFGFIALCSAPLFVGGCAQETRSDVPSNAMQMSSGGKVVAFTAPHDGKAYLRDDTDNRVVYSNDLRHDQVMRFDPATDSVRIDGNAAPEGIPNPEHDHSIFFAPAVEPARPVVSNNTNTVTDNPPGSVPTVRVPIGIQVDVQTQPSTPK